MKFQQEHPVVLLYALIFFAILTISAYTLLIQLQQERLETGEFQMSIIELLDPSKLFY